MSEREDRLKLSEVTGRHIPKRLAIGLVVSGLLILALVRFGNFSKIDVIVEPNPIFLAGFLLATALMVFLSVKRWIIVLKGINLEVVNVSGHYGFYASLGLLLGAIVPQDISSLVVRTHAVRSAPGGSLSRAGLSVIADRLFDVLLLGIALGPALLYLSGVLSQELALLLLGFGFALVILLWLKYNQRAWRQALRLYGSLVSTAGRLITHDRKAEPLDTRDIPTLSQRNAFLVIAISLFRFFTVAGRAFLLVLAFDIDISFAVILLIFSVAQLGLLIPLTPGGLGAVELTWLGVLTAVDVSTEEATVFLIGMRVYSVVSLAVVTAVSYLYYTISTRYASVTVNHRHGPEFPQVDASQVGPDTSWPSQR